MSAIPLLKDLKDHSSRALARVLNNKTPQARSKRRGKVASSRIRQTPTHIQVKTACQFIPAATVA
jgi:hypothetical protein